jgi:hypothetical protein
VFAKGVWRIFGCCGVLWLVSFSSWRERVICGALLCGVNECFVNGDVTQMNKLVLGAGAVVIAVAGYVWVSGSNVEEVADSATVLLKLLLKQQPKP